jgi:hypothetical protein
LDGVKLRRCKICEREQPLSEFYPDRRRKDGLRAECKTCCHDPTGSKRCAGCDIEKPLGDFYKRRTLKIGHQGWGLYSGRCKDCVRASTAARRQPKSPEQIRHEAAIRTELVKNDPIIRGRELARRGARYHRLRMEIINGYGGICECCGEDTYEFLTIDHRYGAGMVDRREFGIGAKFFAHIKREHFPEKYRLLCYNCNMARAFNGVCPHRPDEHIERTVGRKLTHLSRDGHQRGLFMEAT